jgi:hypothetical protein
MAGRDTRGNPSRAARFAQASTGRNTGALQNGLGGSPSPPGLRQAPSQRSRGVDRHGQSRQRQQFAKSCAAPVSTPARLLRPAFGPRTELRARWLGRLLGRGPLVRSPDSRHIQRLDAQRDSEPTLFHAVAGRGEAGPKRCSWHARPRSAPAATNRRCMESRLPDVTECIVPMNVVGADVRRRAAWLTLSFRLVTSAPTSPGGS